MEVSTEISQKIRSAIKAKLMELGAYVDDELPDYIMVMVANKKSRVQMSNDLGLFLGTNTEAFTGWLHGLLGKLQTITVESGDKTKPKERKKDKKEGKEKKKSKKHISESSSSKKKPDLLDKIEQIEIESKQTVSNESAVETTKDNTLKSKTPKAIYTTDNDNGEMDSIKTISIQEDVEDVRQLLVTGTQADELAEELETTEEEVKKSLTLGSKIIKISMSEDPSIAKEKDISTTHHATSKSRSPTPDKSLSSAANRKRKMPISIVANVSKKSDNEEEYDPYNPAVGSVASVVRVTSRRSSVPVSLQANRAADSESAKVAADDGEPPTKMLKVSGAVSLDDIKQVLEDVIQKKYQENNDDVTLFAKMVESSLRKLKAEHLALAKVQIQQVLCGFETSGNVNGMLEELNKSATNQDGTCRRRSKEAVVTPKLVDSDVSVQDGVIIRTSGSELALRPGQSKRSTKSTGNGQLKYESAEPMNSVSSLDSPKGSTKSLMVNDLEVDKKVIYSNSQVRTPAHDTERRFTEEIVPQSPVSTSKIDSGSPSSVHSCPPSSTSGSDSLAVKRCIVSTSTSPSNSRNSQLAEFRPLAGTPSSKDTSIPSIIVDSIHRKSRSDSAEPVSVLKQCVNSGNRTKGLLGAQASDCEEEPTRINPEALKVLAKNLKVTVINKRASQKLDQSSSEDSSSDESDDEDSSEDEDDVKGSIAKERNKQLENDKSLDLSHESDKNF
ncbi:hypothetical protein Btru_069586 [Bulinus truncatus]|nr:hypothetical protein Btru_069586 [Bulinus truncatus]